MMNHFYIGKDNKCYTLPKAFKDLSKLFTDTDLTEFYLERMEPDKFENYIDFLSNFYDKKSEKYVFPSDLGQIFPILEKYDYSDLMILSDYLDISQVSDICCQYMLHLVKGKTPYEIRQIMIASAQSSM